MKVLLIDDEMIALNALKKRVDWIKYGFTEVYTAQDLYSAKQLLREEKIDLVLCDIEMPGENGLDLVEYIGKKYPSTGCIMVTCHAEFEYMRKSMKCRVYDYILKPVDCGELENILEQYAADCQEKQQKKELERIVSRVNEEKAEIPAPPQQRVEEVKKYIEEHLQDKIYVEELARLVHINEQYIMRIFKQQTGRTITEYIAERRMCLASRLLRETNKSVNYIADCVGCGNYSYFAKLFERYTGYTPREYRANFKK